MAQKKVTPKDDPVLANAKIAISKKLKDPNSATFGMMIRAMRPNVRGEPTDTICGYVNAKNSYGGYTGEKPFVYFVQDGSANIASGGQDPTDAMVVGNFCK